jgi:hypothetical protein
VRASKGKIICCAAAFKTLLSAESGHRPRIPRGHRGADTGSAPRDGKVVVHFGVLPDAEGWCAADAARPDADLLGYIRPLRPA